MEHLLDNPVWSALCSGNQNLAIGEKSVKYFPVDVAPFAGLEKNDIRYLHTLHQITPGNDGTFGIVTTSEIDVPKLWTVLHIVPVLQMVWEKLNGRVVDSAASRVVDSAASRVGESAAIADLSDEHVPQMLALTQLTNPGPFRQRTIELGYYQGIFDGKNLVAMAGQRMHPVPYAEISGVCTHPEYVGRGYAAQLILSQIDRICATGEIPFLHVASTNERAIKLYESLGFLSRRSLYVYFMQKLLIL
ncbi:MAG TPA: GNAT family N-acetyltransferase [Puia sp.]|jgi:predicted GNAT family acetyltransferase|nr:GNAT family N-acetyltransferase [Puia sp.]